LPAEVFGAEPGNGTVPEIKIAKGLAPDKFSEAGITDLGTREVKVEQMAESGQFFQIGVAHLCVPQIETSQARKGGEGGQGVARHFGTSEVEFGKVLAKRGEFLEVVVSRG
tara:strand:+ start:428 stop:760 length:333 start_codon:yes stop_codon:yes gene_type:complete